MKRFTRRAFETLAFVCMVIIVFSCFELTVNAEKEIRLKHESGFSIGFPVDVNYISKEYCNAGDKSDQEVWDILGQMEETGMEYLIWSEEKQYELMVYIEDYDQRSMNLSGFSDEEIAELVESSVPEEAISVKYEVKYVGGCKFAIVDFYLPSSELSITQYLVGSSKSLVTIVVKPLYNGTVLVGDSLLEVQRIIEGVNAKRIFDFPLLVVMTFLLLIIIAISMAIFRGIRAAIKRNTYFRKEQIKTIDRIKKLKGDFKLYNKNMIWYVIYCYILTPIFLGCLIYENIDVIYAGEHDLCFAIFILEFNIFYFVLCVHIFTRSQWALYAIGVKLILGAVFSLFIPEIKFIFALLWIVINLVYFIRRWDFVERVYSPNFGEFDNSNQNFNKSELMYEQWKYSSNCGR